MISDGSYEGESLAVKKITKAVIPAAGLGTRFLPATKAQPKEMLPIVDKPAIQYVVEEAVRAGIDDILIITGRSKRAIEDHFDRNFELEYFLEDRGKTAELVEVRRLAELADIHYVRQGEPLGLGHAVSVARKHVGNEPFVVMLGDDIMDDESTVLPDMMKTHEETGASIIALSEFPLEEISSYGCVDPQHITEQLVQIRRIVEKPAPADAPSNLAVMGRYIFTPGIFDALGEIRPGVGGEIQLTDAIELLLQTEPVHGWIFTEGRFDVGRKIDFLRATVELALERGDLGAEFREYLIDLVRNRLT
ncbi:MAG: UTP--glucose-1-phosphate uridylyltransferase GalU [Actinobacteria bacterium]|uniref:UTP--glucose-1-phosphate uridylyltransferase n=1 Tax=freshwater metagenome TaxID=449393 RepID=A0A6J5YCF3_9ZZZZ|nr:UTP--glucose-1-phosphate uridylyltransferase GalU [Actinomycetota bacterium]